MYATLEACFSGQSSRTGSSYSTERLGWGVTSICSLWPCSAKNHLYDDHSPVGPRECKPPWPSQPGNWGASPAGQKLQRVRTGWGKPGSQTCKAPIWEALALWSMAKGEPEDSTPLPDFCKIFRQPQMSDELEACLGLQPWFLIGPHSSQRLSSRVQCLLLCSGDGSYLRTFSPLTTVPWDPPT